jgi:Protein of unknown function (DUF2934)
VPRKPKSSADNKPVDESGLQSANGKSKKIEPKKKTTAASTPSKKKKPGASAKSVPKPQTTVAAKSVADPTDDEIRIRAYFIAERRHKLALPGDSAHDWIEARRQLIEEAKR